MSEMIESTTITMADGTNSTDTVIYEPGKTVSTFSECGSEVRWNGAVLEQAWLVRGIGTTGGIESIKTEWRPVPQKAKR